MDVGSCAQVVVALNQDRVLRSGEVPAELRGGVQEAVAAVGKEGQLDMIQPERHGAEGQQVDVFHCEPREKFVRSRGVVLDSGIEILYGSNC